MADKIKIKITAQDKSKAAFKSVNGNMARLKRASQSMVASLAPLAGIASAGALLMIGKHALDAADEIQKMSQRIGVSTEALSQYRHVAELSGTSLETLAKGVKISQRAIADAGDGLSTATRAFDKMGLSIDDLRKMKPEDAFEAMGEAVANIGNASDRTQTAMAVFGRAGVDLLPVFNKGAAAVRAMRQEVDDFGGTLTQEMANKAAEAKDSMTRLNTAVDSLAQNLSILAAGPLAGFLNEVAAGWSKQGTPMNQFLEEMEKLKEVNPEIYKQMNDLVDANRGASYSWLLASAAALEAGESFSMLQKQYSLVGDGLGVPNFDYVPAVAGAEAMNVSLKDLSYGITDVDEAIINLDEGLALLDWYGEATAIDAVVASSDQITPSFNNAADAATSFSDGLLTEGVFAAETFGDALVDAALRGELAMLSLQKMINSIFASLLKFGISFGLNLLLPVPALPIPGLNEPGGPIGPPLMGSMSPATLGTSAAMAPAARAGSQTTINGGITIIADMPLTNDPMTKRRVAEQLYDEIRQVGKTRGEGGRI